MRLRQVAFAARDLDAVVGDLRAVLGLEVSFNDPSVAVFGLRNAVLPVGDTFLEVVSPVQAETAAARYMARRGGDCGYMVMVQTEDIDSDRRRAAELGVRIAWNVDLDDIRGTHLHPRDLGGALLSLDAAVPPSSWRWAGPVWERSARSTAAREVVAVEMQCAERDVVAARWAALLGRVVQTDTDGGVQIALDRGVLRFIHATGGTDGVTAVEIAVADRVRTLATASARGCMRGHEIVICGTSIRAV
jgi:Glyoxalase-like domain